MRNRSRHIGTASRRGFTLIEVMVAMLLLVILAIVIWQMLSFGIRAHRKGEASRQAQSFAQEILDKITDELRTAVSMPELPQGGFDLFAVLWPAAQIPTGATFASGIPSFYERAEVANYDGTGQNFQSVRNRLVFTRPGRAVDDPDFDPANLDEFVYVEYFVPDTERNVLRRRVYPYQPAGDPANPRHQFTLNHWEILAAQFDGTGLSPETANENDQEVIELPGATDRIEFRVWNGPDTSPGSAYDFSPELFEVEVSTVIGLERDDGDPNDDTNDAFRGSATLRSQSRLRSSSTQ
ncbi:MAG: prepilin-type N-terminal cleavage/methylation domain-containing protein [Armatimonadetes bacterium]|nr:prepilin-type N-terminal cleavage/methylation domain-containing protein [Armatimonadota bacterium]